MYSYSKGIEKPEGLELLLSFNINSLSSGTEVPLILVGDAWLAVQFSCLLQHQIPSQHGSYRRMQRRTKRKLPALWATLYRV